MRKILLHIALVISILVQINVDCLAERSSALKKYLSIYGYNIDEKVENAILNQADSALIKFEDFCVELKEVLYDGKWLYTAAYVYPNDSNTVMILPDDACADDRLMGFYHENNIQDKRTFFEAAKQDKKKLVSIYPEEFDLLPEYFKDHLQLDENETILISGGALESDDMNFEFTWKVQTFEIDIYTGRPLMNTFMEKCIMSSACSLSSIESKTYYAEKSETAPFDSITLSKTGLTVYAYPEWRSQKDNYTFEYILKDEAGHEYPDGAPPETLTFSISELPESFLVCVYDKTSVERTNAERFIAE